MPLHTLRVTPLAAELSRLMLAPSSVVVIWCTTATRRRVEKTYLRNCRWSVEYADGDAGEAEWFELKELLTSWPPKGL